MNPNLFDEAFLQRLERLALLSRRAMAGQTQGERRSPKRGQSVEFADFRPYTLGDDFRRIDWNAYARLERFFIKLFVEEEDLTVHFILDTSQSMHWGEPSKLEAGIRIAGALGYIALAGLDRVTATAPAQANLFFSPHRGKRQALAFFSFLTDLTRHKSDLTGGALAQRLRSYTVPGARPGPLVVISDLMDDGWQEGLRGLSSRGYDLTVIHLLAPEELNPELDGDLKLLDSEGGADIEITADYETLTRYRQLVRDWQADYRAFCAARGIAYIPVDTTVPLETLLFSWLRTQGVLR